jgi:Rps23 Pro-64 3,4-dihydroxylase Tpa1-like proline 4-hydroxylase
MTQISVLDNFLNEESQQSIIDYCKDCDYHWGETDTGDGHPVTGMVSEIEEDSEVFEFFKKAIEQAIPNIKMMELYRMYVNCFAPGENPYFHTDGDDGITFLYYPADTDWEWDPNEGGETQFYIDGSIQGVPPEPNRLVMFDASLLHRATSFRSEHRFTIAIKYEEPNK